MSSEEPAAPTRARSSRDYVVTVVVEVVACIVAMWSLSQPWVTASTTTGFGQQEVTVSGSSVYPLSVAGAWVALALVVAVIATAGSLRRVLGGAIAIAGVAVVVGPVSFLLASEVELATASARVATTDATRTSLWIMTLACGIVVIVAGIVVSMRGAAWRSLSKRQSGAKPASTPWEALDRGDDPTA